MISRRSVLADETGIDGRTLEGYAAVYNQQSRQIHDWNGAYVERIAPGAFRQTLEANEDVLMFFNHQTDMPLARTKSGTLTLRSDRNGLKFTASMPDTTLGNDVVELLRRGDLTGEMSFGFIVEEDSWSKDRSERVVKRAKLLEISVVTDAAYPDTSSALRQFSQRAHILRALTLRAKKGQHEH